MYLKAITCLLFIFVYSSGYSQKTALPDVISPSPTVANLMKFEEVPVNKYTGQPDISIPIFSKDLKNGLDLNIGLIYNTQGIKVNNISGWTGTGWSLTGGGSIARTIRDVPDEAVKGSPGFANKTGVFHNSDYWNYESLPGADQARFNWKAVGSSSDKYDTQPDLYQFNFFDFSGRFVVLKQGGQLVPKLISQNTNLEIEIHYNFSSFVINSFTVVDPNGLRYLFDKIESSSSSQSTFSQMQGSILGETSGTEDSFTANTAWHLSKVTTGNGSVLVNFVYTVSNELYVSALNHTYNDILTSGSSLHDMLQNQYNLSIMEPKKIVSSYYSNTATQKLSQVLFADGTSLEFLMGSNHPENSGSILNEIKIKDSQNTVNKRFVLNYQTTDRLWLLGVTEYGGLESHTTSIQYTNKQNLPVFGSGNTIDDWGYYSGISPDGGEITGCNTSAVFNEDLILTGLINRIEYPTGGVKEFIFDHNAYSYFGNDSIQKAQYSNNPRNNLRISSDYYFDHPNQEPSSDLLTLSEDQKVYVDVNVNSSQQPDLYRLVLEDTNGVSVGQVDIGSNGCKLMGTIPTGIYSFRLKHFDLSLDPYSATGFARIYFTGHSGFDLFNPQLDSGIRKEMIGGGVRIKEINFFNDQFMANPSRSVKYAYNDATDPDKSSGVIDADVNRFSSTYEENVMRYLFSTSENIAGSFFPTVIRYRTTQYGNRINTQLSQGNYVGYRNVVVSETGNGRQVFQYTSPYEYPSPPETFILPNGNPPVNIDYKRGLLLKHSIFDESGNKLKETDNAVYSFVENFIFKDRKVYKPKSCEWMQFYDRWDFYRTPSAEINIPICGLGPCILSYQNCGATPIPQLSINFNSGWAQLKKTVETEYFYDSNNALLGSLVSQKEYEYNTGNYQPKSIKTTLNKGSLVEENLQELYYSSDSFIPGLSAGEEADRVKMASLNMVNSPIYTKRYLNQTLLEESWTVYKEFSTNLLMPVAVRTKKKDGLLQEHIIYQSYDNKGNLLQVNRVDGPPITYIWGYRSQLPIAKVENATYSQIEALSGFGPGFTLGDGGLSAAQENTLRSGLPNAMVTTYSYSTLVGVTSVTDPKGDKVTYHYDAFNRLQYIKDIDNKIIKEYKYNYTSN